MADPCTREHAYSWPSLLCRVTATLDLQRANGILSRTRYTLLTVCPFGWAFQNHAFQIMALLKKKMPFWDQPAPVAAGESSWMTYLCLAAVDSKPLLACLSYCRIQFILLSIGVALEMLCTCCLLPRTILSLNFEPRLLMITFWATNTWLAQKGLNTVLLHFASCMGSTLFSVRGWSNSHSLLSTQVTGFGF